LSQEKVRIVRAAYDAFNRGDFDAAVSLVRPDAEFTRPGVEGPLKGRDAVRAWMEPDAFAEQRVEPLDLQANGNKVLVRQHLFARGAESGIELDLASWAVWTVDDEGFISRADMFPLEQECEALEAAGLRE
jgi:ketosteroid isomerase-like protein